MPANLLHSALIVDDEPVGRDRVRAALASLPRWRVVGECRNGVEAVAAIAETEPDLVILDIRMPGLGGFGVIERVGPERMPAVLFVTAHEEHAVRAFEVHAIDYIVKPFTDERFRNALARVEGSLAADRREEVTRRLVGLLEAVGGSVGAGAGAGPTRFATRLSVPVEGGVLLVAVADIDYMEAARNYVRIQVGTQSYLLRSTLAELVERLDPGQFARIHRSAVVNLTKVREIRDGSLVTLTTGARLKVGRQYRDRLLEALV
jgi:two-component system LytT family response regulator